MQSPSLQYQSMASYTCNEGYLLMGDEVRACQSSGLWSGQQPTCECEKLLIKHNIAHVHNIKSFTNSSLSFSLPYFYLHLSINNIIRTQKMYYISMGIDLCRLLHNSPSKNITSLLNHIANFCVDPTTLSYTKDFFRLISLLKHSHAII